jgi:starch phosphorylase
MLNDRWRPIQIIFAGKAHPADDPGKQILQKVFNVCRDHGIGGRIAFVEDYGEQIAQYLVHGVDLWLNTPLPPMEASGTSGMKAAFNGIMNLSTLDGWWCEGYRQDGGWAIGSGEVYPDAEYQDTLESQSLYEILEKEVIPLFYTRSVDGLPRAWIQRMKHTVRWVVPRFNTHRMLADYTRRF